MRRSAVQPKGSSGVPRSLRMPASSRIGPGVAEDDENTYELTLTQFQDPDVNEPNNTEMGTDFKGYYDRSLRQVFAACGPAAGAPGWPVRRIRAGKSQPKRPVM